MPIKANFFRLLAIPACLVWGVRELISLQRARWRTSTRGDRFKLSRPGGIGRPGGCVASARWRLAREPPVTAFNGGCVA